MKLAGVFLAIVFASTLVSASKPAQLPEKKGTHLQIPMSRTLNALGLPLPNAMKALSSQGVSGYKNLQSLAFSLEQPIEVQWKALMMLSVLGGNLSLPQLEAAASSDQWYMRNAALMNLSRVNRDKAVQWARKLLTDPSLIVRTSAVQTIKDLHDTESADALWTQLYNRQNFRQGQSLWVRRRITETLADFARKGDEARLVGVLRDSDQTLYPSAIEGLEKITQQKLGQPRESIAFKRQYWQRWWEQQARM